MNQLLPLAPPTENLRPGGAHGSTPAVTRLRVLFFLALAAVVACRRETSVFPNAPVKVFLTASAEESVPRWLAALLPRFLALELRGDEMSGDVLVAHGAVRERFGTVDVDLRPTLEACEAARSDQDLKPAGALRLVRALHAHATVLELFDRARDETVHRNEEKPWKRLKA